MALCRRFGPLAWMAGRLGRRYFDRCAFDHGSRFCKFGYNDNTAAGYDCMLGAPVASISATGIKPQCGILGDCDDDPLYPCVHGPCRTVENGPSRAVPPIWSLDYNFSTCTGYA